MSDQGPEGRRSARRPIEDVPVTVEAPTLDPDGWIVPALDLNLDGMALVLPHEIPSGTVVLLSFRLPNGDEFHRVPAKVVHRQSDRGGLVWAIWHESERLRLADYLTASPDDTLPVA